MAELSHHTNQAIERYSHKGISKVRKLLQLDHKYNRAPNAQEALTDDLTRLRKAMQSQGNDHDDIAMIRKTIGQHDELLSRLLGNLDYAVSNVFGYQLLRVADTASEFGEFYYRDELARSLRSRTNTYQSAFEIYGNGMRTRTKIDNYYGLPNGIKIDPDGNVIFYDFYPRIGPTRLLEVATRCRSLKRTASDPASAAEIAKIIADKRAYEIERRIKYHKPEEKVADKFDFNAVQLGALSLQNNQSDSRWMEGQEGYTMFTGLGMSTEQNRGLVQMTIDELTKV